MEQKITGRVENISHSCYLKFQFIYSNLKSAERKAADFCLHNPDFVSASTISDVAVKAGCSEATFVRLAKRLGYGGYPELRDNLLREDSEEIVHSFGISRSDNSGTIVKAVFNASILALKDSLASLDLQSLEKATEVMLNARHILFASSGDASIVSQSGVQKFMRIGLSASYNADYDTQLISLSKMDERDVLICASHSGRTRNVCELAEVANGRKVFVVSLTNFPQSPLVKLSDVVLLTASFAHDMMGEILAKRVPALCLIDVIHVLLLLRLGDDRMRILDNGNKLLRKNKL